MPATYEPIATTTLGSAASSITFSSIPATYTDLKVMLVSLGTSSGDNVSIRFNSDTNTLYSATRLYGNGSTVTSDRYGNSDSISLDFSPGSSTTIPYFFQVDVFSYAGSTNKTFLITGGWDRNGSGTTARQVALYRSTSAITSVNLFMGSNNFATGTTATLYGIKNA